LRERACDDFRCRPAHVANPTNTQDACAKSFGLSGFSFNGVTNTAFTPEVLETGHVKRLPKTLGGAIELALKFIDGARSACRDRLAQAHLGPAPAFKFLGES
jgi:hypothetical protein